MTKKSAIPNYEKNYHGSQLRVCLVREGRSKRQTYIKTPEDIYNLVKKRLCESDREIFLSILISTDGSLIGVEEVAVGTLDECLISPRELFKSAILANAAKVIICHYHPSGSLRFSGTDIKLTKTLLEAGRILCIDVDDHVLVTHRGYRSHRKIDENLF